MYQRRLCVLALGVALVLACSTAAPGKVLFEYWFDIGGTSVNDNLRTACSFPDRPSQSELLDALKSPVDWKDNYGLRARAYLTPAADGDYTFWVSGDDNCQLWLSTDDSAANAKLVAQVAGWTPVETWDWEAGQKSAPIALKAGQKYYIEMLLKEGGGGDSITAAWGGPGIGDGPVVIAGGVLTEFVRTSFPAVCPNPVSGSVDIVAPLFTWTAAANGMMDDIYFGTDPNPGFMNKQPSAMALFFYPMPLEPGATYYWRVDTTSTTGVLSTGKVWSFTVMPLTAHFPSPPDGAVYRPTNLTVSWTAGQNAGTYKVYGSEDQAAVAAGDAGALLVEQAETSLDASALLEPLKTYYWRVDTVDLNGALQAGPVWTFSTYDPAGGAVAEYWAKRPASGAPDVVKNVGEINFDWGGGTVPGQNSPDAAIPVDNFSCRWTAELNVPVTGTYKLYEASDDGARLFLNGEKVAEGWVDRGTTEDATGPLELVAGERYQVVMEMYENGGGAAAFLRWSGPGIAKEIIPQGALQMPTMAFSPIPANGAMNVDTRAALTWLAGSTAAEHNVYLGTDPNLVAAGDASVFQGAVAEASFVPAAALDAMTTYYWSVDEVTADGTVIPGLVWSFTVQSSFGVIEITDPTLLIYYDFEFGLGSTVPDMSGHGNHGLFMGNPEWTTDIFGGCLSIDSADLDYIQTETPLGIVSNTVSVTAWVKHDQTPAAWSGILTHRGTSPGCFGLQHNGSEGPLGAELRYMWGADQYWDFSSGLLIPNGEWYFAALTIAPDQAKFYLNGLDQTATNVAEHVPVNFDSLIRVGRETIKIVES